MFVARRKAYRRPLVLSGFVGRARFARPAALRVGPPRSHRATSSALRQPHPPQQQIYLNPRPARRQPASQPACGPRSRRLNGLTSAPARDAAAGQRSRPPAEQEQFIEKRYFTLRKWGRRVGGASARGFLPSARLGLDAAAAAHLWSNFAP